MHRLKKIIKPFEGLIKKRTKDQKNNKLKQGCYLYELEADSTIPSEYILLMHFLGEINVKLEIKIQNYLFDVPFEGVPPYEKAGTTRGDPVHRLYKH